MSRRPRIKYINHDVPEFDNIEVNIADANVWGNVSEREKDIALAKISFAFDEELFKGTEVDLGNQSVALSQTNDGIREIEANGGNYKYEMGSRK